MTPELKDRQVRSILVIKFRHLGDLVLASSLFRNLRLHFPSAHLAALVDAAFAEPLRYMADVDEIVPFPRERARGGSLSGRIAAWTELLRAIRGGRRFDLVIDLADSSTSHTLVWASGSRMRVGYAGFCGQRRRPPYTILATPFSDGTHYLDHFLQPLAALSLPIIHREPQLSARPADQSAILCRLESVGLKPRGFIAVHPGSRILSKCWPPARFAEAIDTLAQETGLKAVLLGTAGERPLTEAVAAACRSKPVDFAGGLSFGELVALLGCCRVFIGNDTGPAHLAAAAGAPSVVLFGLETPARWGPVGRRVLALRPSQPCPCLHPGICQPDHPDRTLCVQRIPVEDVVAAARRQLGAAPGGSDGG